jgi:hypothetical protein
LELTKPEHAMELRSSTQCWADYSEGEREGMTPRLARSAHGLEPKAVVVAAYEAANRGRYDQADAFLAPSFKRSLERVPRITQASSDRTRRLLHALQGRRDADAVRGRKSLHALLKSQRILARLEIGSRRFRRSVWDAMTYKRSLVAIEAHRQVVRGTRARVYLKLSLRDGTVVRDSEPLVFQRSQWRIG